MSAFDEARSGAAPTGRRGVRAPGAAVRAGGPGGAAAASAIEVVSGGDGYQSSDAAYATMCSAVEADLNSASQSAAQLRKQRDQVGSRQDSEDLRHRIAGNITTGHTALRRVNEVLQRQFPGHVERAAATSGAGGREHSARKIQQKRFMADAAAVAKQFQDAAQAAKRATDATPVPAGAASHSATGAGKAGAAAGGITDWGPTSSSSSAGVAAGGRRGAGAVPGASGGRTAAEEDQIMAQMRHVDLTTALMGEREGEIDALASEVLQVNAIMKDLAGLVEEQGKAIDDLEANVGDAVVSTETGVGHLTQAAKYAARYRKCLIVFVVLLLLIAGGLTAYFLISNRK